MNRYAINTQIYTLYMDSFSDIDGIEVPSIIDEFNMEDIYYLFIRLIWTGNVL